MAKKPRKPHTSRKRIITPETRTKIARALAAKLGPTSDWDKPEPTGRKTNGIDKTTGHKITTGKKVAKLKNPPNPNTIYNPNGGKAGGHRASDAYLKLDRIKQEPMAREHLQARMDILNTKTKVNKYLDQLDERIHTANIDTGNNATNRQNQRIALKHMAEAQMLGLMDKDGQRTGNMPTLGDDKQAGDKGKGKPTTKQPTKKPYHPKTHNTYTPEQQQQEHKNPAQKGGIIHQEAAHLTPLQLKRLAKHYGLEDPEKLNQLGVQSGNPKFRKTQAFETAYDNWLLDKLGTKLGASTREELDTKLTELNGGKDPHKTMISPIMFQTATPELRALIEQELGYLPSRRNMERDKAGQPKPHPRAGLKISQKRTQQETDARDLTALKADQKTIQKQEKQAKEAAEKQRIINRRATHKRDEYQANQDDTAKALQHAHRNQQLGKHSRFSQETKEAEAKFNAEHPIDSYRPLAQKILDTEWDNYKQGNLAPVSITAQKGRPTNPTNTAVYAKAAEENGGFPKPVDNPQYEKPATPTPKTDPKPETKHTIPAPKRNERIMRKHTADGETFDRDGIIRNGIKIKKANNGYNLEVPGRDTPVELTYDHATNTGPEDLNDARAAVDRITEDLQLGVAPSNYWLGSTEKEISKTVDDSRLRPYLESNKLRDAEALRNARKQAITTGKNPSASKQPTDLIHDQTSNVTTLTDDDGVPVYWEQVETPKPKKVRATRNGEGYTKLKNSLSAISTDDTLPLFTSVAVENNGDGTLTLTSTDRYRLTRTTVKGSMTGGDGTRPTLLKGKDLKAVLKDMKNDDGLTINVDRGKATVNGHDVGTTDMDFPDVLPLMRKDASKYNTAEFDRGSMIELMKRIKKDVKGTRKQVILEPNEDKTSYTVQWKNKYGDVYTTTIPATITGDNPPTVGFHADYLSDVVNHQTTGQNIHMGSTGPTRPVFFGSTAQDIAVDTDNSNAALLMPVRLPNNGARVGIGGEQWRNTIASEAPQFAKERHANNNIQDAAERPAVTKQLNEAVKQLQAVKSPNPAIADLQTYLTEQRLTAAGYRLENGTAVFDPQLASVAEHVKKMDKPQLKRFIETAAPEHAKLAEMRLLSDGVGVASGKTTNLDNQIAQMINGKVHNVAQFNGSNADTPEKLRGTLKTLEGRTYTPAAREAVGKTKAWLQARIDLAESKGKPDRDTVEKVQAKPDQRDGVAPRLEKVKQDDPLADWDYNTGDPDTGILTPKGYKVEIMPADSLGRQSITNPEMLISVALQNEHDFNKRQQLRNLWDSTYDKPMHMWLEDGQIRASGKLTIDQRIALEFVAETVGTELKQPAWRKQIPEGRVHHSDLREKGWTADQIGQLQSVQKLDNVPTGVNKRTYDAAEVAHLQATDKAIKKNVEARALIIPKLDPEQLQHAELLSRAQLKKRGWSDTWIKKVLGAPDDRETNNSYSRYGETHYWAAERADEAEKRYPQLAAKVEANKAKYRAAEAERKANEAKEKADKLAKLKAEGTNVYRKINGQWVVSGTSLEAGKDATVTLKNGETKEVHIKELITHNGETYGVTGPSPKKTGKATPQRKATPRQISFAWKLLTEHSKEFGVLEGEPLMLDAFSMKFPTYGELTQMSAADVSDLIYMLLNDSM